MNQTVDIGAPSELEHVIRVVKASLADATLMAESPAADPAFGTIEVEGPWPDIFDYAFRCAHCGQRYQLEVETFHGAGGRWRPG